MSINVKISVNGPFHMSNLWNPSLRCNEEERSPQYNQKKGKTDPMKWKKGKTTQYNEKKGKNWPNIMKKGQNDPI